MRVLLLIGTFLFSPITFAQSGQMAREEASVTAFINYSYFLDLKEIFNVEGEFTQLSGNWDLDLNKNGRFELYVGNGYSGTQNFEILVKSASETFIVILNVVINRNVKVVGSLIVCDTIDNLNVRVNKSSVFELEPSGRHLRIYSPFLVSGFVENSSNEEKPFCVLLTRK